MKTKTLALAALMAAMLVTSGQAQAAASSACETSKYQTAAEILARTPPDCKIAYAIDTDVFYVRANGAWTALSTLTTLAGANGGTFVNDTNHMWDLSENSETVRFNFATANKLTLSSATGVTDLLTALDIYLGGGVGALQFNAADSSILTTDNSATGLAIGSTDRTDLIVLDTRNGAEGLILTGYQTISATLGVTGVLTLAGGAGGLTFSNTAAAILTGDADTSALDVGSAGLTDALRYSSANDLETFTFKAGVGNEAVSVTGAASLDASDCGSPIFVTAAHDGNSITLPALTAVPAGCTYRFFYVGADAGALLDISPNASDGIEGGCTLAASVVQFSGDDDADIGLTKASIQKGDTITLTAGDADDWYASAIQGICANN